MRKFLVILFLTISFSLFPICKIKADASSAGFVSSNNIWYSNSSPKEGDNVGIYTLVFNPDNNKLSGTVAFFDNSIVLGTKKFTVAANGVQGIHINWIATPGSHTIFGSIQNAEFLNSDGTSEEANLTEKETTKSQLTVLEKVNPSETNSNTETADSGLIQNIENTVKKDTPAPVSQSINSVSDSVEKLRENLNTSSENAKGKLQNEIKTLDNNEKSGKKETTQNQFLKPFDYIKLFFYTIFSFIFSNKIIFYAILVFLIFFILRFIWRKIF